MAELRILEGQVIVRVEEGEWPDGHKLEIEVEGGHVLEVGPRVDWQAGQSYLEILLNDESLR